jgi:hypothetical protein
VASRRGPPPAPRASAAAESRLRAAAFRMARAAGWAANFLGGMGPPPGLSYVWHSPQRIFALWGIPHRRRRRGCCLARLLPLPDYVNRTWVARLFTPSKPRLPAWRGVRCTQIHARQTPAAFWLGGGCLSVFARPGFDAFCRHVALSSIERTPAARPRVPRGALGHTPRPTRRRLRGSRARPPAARPCPPHHRPVSSRIRPCSSVSLLRQRRLVASWEGLQGR